MSSARLGKVQRLLCSKQDLWGPVIWVVKMLLDIRLRVDLWHQSKQNHLLLWVDKAAKMFQDMHNRGALIEFLVFTSCPGREIGWLNKVELNFLRGINSLLQVL